LEHAEVQFGLTRIPYAIRRSPRRKTVAVTVHPRGDIILTAPLFTSVERLNRVIHQKANWIKSKLRLVDSFKAQPEPKECVPAIYRNSASRAV
jgi:predicted metal-dependent hydrolase